jgi:hypothetical protein
MVPWPENAMLARFIVLLFSAVQLTYAWWYLRGWYWLPKSSWKKTIGWVMLFAAFLVFPLEIYPANAHSKAADAVVSVIVMMDAVVFIALLLYMVKKGRPL